jgi:hypothetical protein
MWLATTLLLMQILNLNLDIIEGHGRMLDPPQVS